MRAPIAYIVGKTTGATCIVGETWMIHQTIFVYAFQLVMSSGVISKDTTKSEKIMTVFTVSLSVTVEAFWV